MSALEDVEQNGNKPATEDIDELLKVAEEVKTNAKSIEGGTESTENSTPVVEQQAKVGKKRPGRAPEIPVFERKNWLLHLHYIRKEYNICKGLIKELLLESGGFCEYALYVNALILREEGRIQESLELFEKCWAINHTNPNNLKQVGRSLFLLGRHKAALNVYEELMNYINDWEVFHNQGVCHMYLRKISKAKDLFSKALKLNPHDISFVMLGKCHLLEGNPDEAAKVYHQAILHSPETPDLMITLGLLYLQLGHNQKAFEQFGNALTYDPTNVKAIIAAGAMIQNEGDFEVALTKYRIAAWKTPESPQLWSNIAMCLFGKKKFVASISCLKRAAYLAPFEWTILYNLGLVHLSLRQYASAFHYLSAAITLKPKHGKLFMLLAVTLTHLNSLEDAKQAYTQAIQYESHDPMNYLNFALLLKSMNDWKGAANQFSLYKKKLALLKETLLGTSIDPQMEETAQQLEAVLQVGSVQTESEA